MQSSPRCTHRHAPLLTWPQWSIDESRVYVAKFKAALKDKKTHSYYEM